MTGRVAKQSICAYLLLAIVLWLVWLVAIKPLTVTYAAHYRQTEQIREQVNTLTDQISLQGRQNQVGEERIQALLRDGRLGNALRSGEANHLLQTIVKDSLNDVSASPSQLRPDSSASSQAIQQSQLDVSFRLNANSMGQFLTRLNASTPTISVDHLSLRRPARFARQELEANATFSLLYLNERFAQQSFDHSSDAPVVVEDETLNSALSSLFNASIRAKLRNPGPQHYRLTAASISANDRMAIITDLTSDTTHRLRIGEQLDSWTIRAIKSDEVELVMDDRVERLALGK